MKYVMENWLKNWEQYNMKQGLSEKVNHLDSGKRYVYDQLVEIEEPRDSLSISPEEKNKIAQWANLSGSEGFLGSGSEGYAYKYGDKVVKFTSGVSEVQAAMAIQGKEHPNVYDILQVGQRSREDMDQSEKSFKQLPYIVIYEYLEYPNKAMVDVGQQLYHKVRQDDKYYRWEESNLRAAENLMMEFVSSVKNNPALLGEPAGKHQSNEPLIRSITEQLGWDANQQDLFIELWTLTSGKYGKYMESVEGVIGHTQEVLEDPRLNYFHQLCLGLTFLFNNGVKFDDVKTTNIMQKNGQAAIIDIGKGMVRSSAGDPPLIGAG
jgi:hypothetical protein